MKALRQIKDITDNHLVLDLPNEFVNKKVEVIILSIEQDKPAKKKNYKKRLLKFFKEPIKVDQIKHFSRDELHAR